MLLCGADTKLITYKVLRLIAKQKLFIIIINYTLDGIAVILNWNLTVSRFTILSLKVVNAFRNDTQFSMLIYQLDNASKSIGQPYSMHWIFDRLHTNAAELL